MPIRLALFALAVGLWSCGDDDSAPTAAAVDSMIATADSMLVAANTMIATADSMITAANTMIAADADSTIAADADAMLAAANDMTATANSMIAAANAMVAADADSTIAANANAMLAAASAMLAAADSTLAAIGSRPAPAEAVLRPTGELQPWDLSSIVSVEEVRAMPLGTPVFMRTEYANGELADLEMTFVQVVDDFLPPMPVYMFETSDPVLIQLGGIARGMSGSPVFTEQGTWGAVAYAFNEQTQPPYYGFATPIEWVIGTRGPLPAAKPTATWEGNSIAPLDIPVLDTGLNDVHPQPKRRSSLLSKTVAASTTEDRQESFAAGRPLAIAFLLGERTVAGLGAISYVDGNRIYGFGHPLDRAGPVTLPIIEAKVLGEVSNLSSPFKYATMNPTVRGTLTEDRLPAVRGLLDEEPALVPIRSVYAFPAGSTVEFTHRMATGIDPYSASDLVSSAFFSPLFSRIDNDPDHSIRVTTDISFIGSDSRLARSRLYASPGGQLGFLVFAAYDEVGFALAELMTRNDYALEVRAAEVQVEIIPETRFASVTEVAADTIISLGSTLDITTLLRVGRVRDRQIELALSVPDTLPVGSYQLRVGAAASSADDALSFDSSESLSSAEGAETLDDVFARLNKPDDKVRLEARLTFVSPPAPEGGEEDGEFDDFFGGFDPFSPPPPPASIATQEDVGLLLEGSQTLAIEVVAP